jgi:hypothetical protein
MRHYAIAVTLWAAATAGYADEVPHRKPGLWEVVTHSGNSQRPPMTQRICLDRDTESLLDRAAVASSQEACSKSETHVSGTLVTVKATCDLGKTRLTTEASIEFESDSAYHTEVHSTFNPPMRGKSTDHSTQDAKWTGACPADMKPGDMVMQVPGPHPSVTRINLRSLLSPKF